MKIQMILVVYSVVSVIVYLLVYNREKKDLYDSISVPIVHPLQVMLLEVLLFLGIFLLWLPYIAYKLYFRGMKLLLLYRMKRILNKSLKDRETKDEAIYYLNQEIKDTWTGRN